MDENLQILTGIKTSTTSRRSIRIIDLTNQFNKCDGMIKNMNGVYFPYEVTTKLSPFLNTGSHRDITIYKFKKLKDTIYLVLLVSSFECNLNIKTNYQINLEYKIEDNSFEKINSRGIDISGQEKI